MSCHRPSHPSLRRSAVYLAVLATFGLPQAGYAANPGDPVGPEFRVNRFTFDYQGQPAVAVDADGDAVVVWYGVGNSGDGIAGDIFAQRYNASGKPVGRAFRVNTYTTSRQSDPAVAIDADGDFVVTWESFLQDGSGYGIYAQRYDDAGNAVGDEFRANTYTTSRQSAPAVAIDADGDFVIAWYSVGQDGSDYGIYAQRYDAAGTAAGDEFRANTYTTSRQADPAVAIEADGDFLIAWHSQGQDGSGFGVYAQRYGASGNSVGDEFRANTYTTDHQFRPAVAVDADGDFLIAWTSDGQDGSAYGVFAQRYDAAGNAVGGEFRANTYTTSIQSGPAVAINAGGDFVIAWNSFAQVGSFFGVFAQRYEADGSAIGDEFRANTYTTGGQTSPAVAADADGDFLIAWESFGQDGSGYGIYAQRYAGPEPIDLALSKLDSPDPLPSGGTLTYTLRVDNQHASVAPTGFFGIDGAIGSGSGLRLWDFLPSGTSFRSASGAGWNCAQALFSGARGVECLRGDALVAGASSTVEITVGAPNGSTILRNVASLTSDQFDPDLFNNEDSADTQVNNTAPTISAIADQRIARDSALIDLPFRIEDLETPEGLLSISGASNNPALVNSASIFFAGEGNDRRVTVLPNDGATGQALIQITVRDAEGLAATRNFRLSVADLDTTPTAFAFTDVNGVARSTVQTSNSISVSGIDAPTVIAVVGGSYAINAGAYISTPGMVVSGDTVSVRHTSSALAGSAVSTSLSIGGVADTFTSTTGGADTTPDPFGFINLTDARRGRVQTSNTITVSGIDAPAPISVVNGQYSVNGGSFVSGARTVRNGDRLRLRHRSSLRGSTVTTTTLRIGGVSGSFSTTTRR